MELNDWLIVICSISGVFIGMSLRSWRIRMQRQARANEKTDRLSS